MIKSNLSQYRNRSTAYQYWQYEINWVLCLSRAINSSPMTQTRRPITKSSSFPYLLRMIKSNLSQYRNRSTAYQYEINWVCLSRAKFNSSLMTQTRRPITKIVFFSTQWEPLQQKKINLPIHKQLSKIFTCSLCIFNKVKLFYKK